MRSSTDSILSQRARDRRWAEFQNRFPDISAMRVLDLGGQPSSWEVAPVKPASVMVVNLDRRPHSTDLVEYVVGDACDLPADVRRRTFDLVFSNSLIEHVGGHGPRKRVAETVNAMADHHWVQTPYRYFPIEPHWTAPAMQFLPLAARVSLARRLPFGPASRHTADHAVLVDEVSMVDLVCVTEMRLYFPHSKIWREKFAGLTKSLVAIR
jgi:hypothetical protein